MKFRKIYGVYWEVIGDAENKVLKEMLED